MRRFFFTSHAVLLIGFLFVSLAWGTLFSLANFQSVKQSWFYRFEIIDFLLGIIGLFVWVNAWHVMWRIRHNGTEKIWQRFWKTNKHNVLFATVFTGGYFALYKYWFFVSPYDPLLGKIIAFFGLPLSVGQHISFVISVFLSMHGIPDLLTPTYWFLVWSLQWITSYYAIRFAVRGMHYFIRLRAR